MHALRTLASRSVFCRLSLVSSCSRIFGFSTEAPQTTDKKPEQSAPPKPEMETLEADYKKILQAKNEFEDKYKRALAESENVRKRMLRQVEEAKLFGIQSFCKDLLDVADILAKATESAPEDQLKPDVNPHFLQLHEGLKMTNAQLLKVFGKHNLHRIAPEVGDKFDPNFHEAVFTVPIKGENEPNTIANVTKVGYRLQERTLRPAFVGVFVAS
uniref:GrpE protein homolog n=1 Tax=Schistocephalus solidus TaxID=70667 RepID=A0A0X3NN29_SCHSO